MEQRYDPRFPADLEIRITDLSAPEARAMGRIRDISQSGVCVVSPLRLSESAVVKLEFADSSLFGYAVYCTPEGPAFRTGIEVQRVLIGGTNLSQLLKSVLREQMPQVAGLDPVAR